jgi:hypothetical protein
MMSSIGRGNESEEALKAGIDAYLTKPVKQSKFFDIIAAVVGTSVEEPSAPKTTAEALGGPSPTDAPLVASRALGEPKSGDGAHSARLLVAEDNAVNRR